jgi:hypothetical protein
MEVPRAPDELEAATRAVSTATAAGTAFTVE